MNIHRKKSAYNPYLPAFEFVPDGEPRVFDGRVYVFGSHDEAYGNRYCTGNYVCWSARTDDLGSWQFEGIIWRKDDDPDYADEKVDLFAPDCVKGPDGRYYLYYFSNKMEKIGVAVSNTPGGKYRFHGNVKFKDGSLLGPGSGFGLPFDPSVLSDETGNWLYYGFALQKRLPGFPESGYEGGFAVALEDDMLTMMRNPVKVLPGKRDAVGTGYEGHAFLEASSIRHIGDLYYLVYSSEQGHELCYATSPFPDRDFHYRGVIISNGDVGLDGRSKADAVNYLGNNHGGIAEINDQYYIFWHRHTHGAQYSRQGCAERITIQKNGLITQVEITSCGLNAGPLPARDTYSAHIACYLRSKEGIIHFSSHEKWNGAHPLLRSEKPDGTATDANVYIANMKDGTVCGFKYLLFDGSETEIQLRLRGDFRGEVQVMLDAPESENVLTTVVFEAAEQWKSAAGTFSGIYGKHGLYLRTSGEGALDLDEFTIL